MTLKDDLLRELDSLIAEGQRLEASYVSGKMGLRHSQLPEIDFQTFTTSARAAINRIAGTSSEFYSILPAKSQRQIAMSGHGAVAAVTGALIALRRAVDAGLLVGMEDRLRANIHDGFLDQADVLLKAGYHVAAMVLIGGVLEDHLHKLCAARALAWKGDGSLSKYNDALYGASLYAKTVLSRIQAIAHVRNDAAHGNGAAVKRDDVDDALTYVRRFLADHPA